jgi:hypothetical protein
MTKEKVTNEKKNLYRLAGEFLVVSRLAQRGYTLSLQWGSTVGYDLFVFDKDKKMAYLEIKTTASYRRCWALQRKYAFPEASELPIDCRFICLVDMTSRNSEPSVYVIPAEIVVQGLTYLFNGQFPNSPTLRFELDKKPQGKSLGAIRRNAG